VRGNHVRDEVRSKREAAAKKEARDKELEELRQAAYLQEVAYERKQAAKRAKEEREKREQKAREAKLRKEMLEAAFDGEDEDLVRLLGTEGADVEAADAHGNTLLSEAAAGGSGSTVKLLLDRGALPNTVGEHGRTPLWRACFMGKEECVRPLLEAGADPRLANSAGETCMICASVASIKTILGEWDLSVTEELLRKLALADTERKEKAAQVREERKKGKEALVEEVQRNHDSAQKALKVARVELERRIFEYDTCVHESKPEEITKVALAVVKDFEGNVTDAEWKASQAAEALADAKLALRREIAELKGEEMDADDEPLPGVEVEIIELDDVLIRDVGNVMAQDGRWPLVVDVSKQASVFLRYLDTNFVSACASTNMEPNKLRRSLLGSVRYGKPMVVDLLDVDMFDEVSKCFDAIEPGLMRKVLSKEIITKDGYLSLIRPQDGEEYQANNYQADRLAAFKFVFLTCARRPSDQLLEACYTIRVKPPTK